MDHQFKGKREFANLQRLVCDKDGHIGARQVFCLLYYPLYQTPTIKHHCPRTALAASIRSCSNSVYEDKAIFSVFTDWWKETYKPYLLSKYLQEDYHVSFEGWLERPAYDSKYKEKMRKAANPANMDVGKVSCIYEAFAKIEMQFTSVTHDDKNKAINDVKERQICGPIDRKKVAANAFINIVEEMAHKYNKYYCGRKNWMEICQDFELATVDIPNIIWMAADGSGFDMTQRPMHNAIINDFYFTLLDSSHVTMDACFDKNEIKQILRDSLVAKVSVDRGALTYRNNVRQSGDGWTTEMNTELMVSYWKFTMYLAEVPEHQFCLRVKGDDVLIGMNQKYRPAVERVVKILFADNKNKQRKGLGQICKKLEWGCITQLDFLSCHFFYTDQARLRMTRIPERVFQTTSYSTKLLKTDGDDVAQQLCYAKGHSLLAWSKGLPIFEKLGRKMIALGKAGPRTDYNYYSDYGRVWAPRDDYMAYCFYLQCRYGITLEHVKAIERKIDSISSRSGLVEIPELQLFFNTGLVGC